MSFCGFRCGGNLSWHYQKTTRFTWLGRHRKEKKDTLKEFQHSLAELVDLMGQDKVKIGPRWGQDRANLGEDRANLGQHRANLGEDRVNIGAR